MIQKYKYSDWALFWGRLIYQQALIQYFASILKIIFNFPFPLWVLPVKVSITTNCVLLGQSANQNSRGSKPICIQIPLLGCLILNWKDMRRQTFTQLYAGKFGVAPVISKDTCVAAANSQTFILRGLLMGVFLCCSFYHQSKKLHVLGQRK